MRAFAETHSDAWYILSAEYGLLDPKQVVGPYERTLRGMTPLERSNWGIKVQAQLKSA
jgi:hypothetical protein